jgi:hypothetical protein
MYGCSQLCVLDISFIGVHGIALFCICGIQYSIVMTKTVKADSLLKLDK